MTAPQRFEDFWKIRGIPKFGGGYYASDVCRVAKASWNACAEAAEKLAKSLGQNHARLHHAMPPSLLGEEIAEAIRRLKEEG